MLLTNYDFYDIYSVICSIRFYPMAKENAEIIQTLMDIINEEQTDNCIIDNVVRRRLTSERFSDFEHWKWMQTFNTYSYGVRVIKDKEKYMVLFNMLSELSDCINLQERERIFDCADALHNVPIILADESKHIKKRVLSEIKHYSRKWNALTYDAIKVIKF